MITINIDLWPVVNWLFYFLGTVYLGQNCGRNLQFGLRATLVGGQEVWGINAGWSVLYGLFLFGIVLAWTLHLPPSNWTFLSRIGEFLFFASGAVIGWYTCSRDRIEEARYRVRGY